ncbi:MAG TPA: insulinase family protein, partial [Myxococcaceae bacterium]|nr:insulinase family protein [Myxococcaceae bacterium]
LRESKGYSYGAYAYLDNRLGTGPLVLGGSVRADATGPALAEIFKELEGLGFAAARLFWLRQPMDRYQKMIAGLQGAKAAAVQSVAETYFDPRLLRLVLVGDPDVIRAQVEPLNLGAVSMPPAPGASP